jgi:hypothetical protein
MDALDTARELLRDVTPLYRDCGALCGRACCRQDETGEHGMALFAGEEAYYTRDPAFIIKDDGRILCRGECDRHNRPLACRIFPLVILAGGKVAPDIRAYPVCPLATSGKRGLSGVFVHAVETAAQILAVQEEQAAFLKRVSHDVGAYKALRAVFKRRED